MKEKLNPINTGATPDLDDDAHEDQPLLSTQAQTPLDPRQPTARKSGWLPCVMLSTCAVFGVISLVGIVFLALFMPLIRQQSAVRSSSPVVQFVEIKEFTSDGLILRVQGHIMLEIPSYLKYVGFNVHIQPSQWDVQRSEQNHGQIGVVTLPDFVVWPGSPNVTFDILTQINVVDEEVQQFVADLQKNQVIHLTLMGRPNIGIFHDLIKFSSVPISTNVEVGGGKSSFDISDLNLKLVTSQLLENPQTLQLIKNALGSMINSNFKLPVDVISLLFQFSNPSPLSMDRTVLNVTSSIFFEGVDIVDLNLFNETVLPLNDINFVSLEVNIHDNETEALEKIEKIVEKYTKGEAIWFQMRKTTAWRMSDDRREAILWLTNAIQSLNATFEVPRMKPKGNF